MAVPGFQEITLPLLKITADGREHRLSEVVAKLADEFRLPQTEREELLPSGRQARFANRVGWAKTYLSKALLLENTGRATFRITERGKAALARSPVKIDIPFLLQYEETKQFRARSIDSEGPLAQDVGTDASPEELIEFNFKQHRAQLIDDLLERVRLVTPARFESLVLDVLLAMGYGGSRPDAGRRLGMSGDGGVDGVIDEDPLGLDVVYIQAKRWQNNVGRPEVQAFAGSLAGERAGKGVFITTSGFTKDAIEYVRFIDKRIVLIDGQRLCELMAEHGVGVSVSDRYEIKRVAIEYFEDD